MLPVIIRSIKRLAPCIKTKGFEYRQIRRGIRAVLYSQSLKRHIVGYEVFRIKDRKSRIIKGIIIQPAEIFPPDEAFGVWAWTTCTEEKAIRKFRELEADLTTQNPN